MAEEVRVSTAETFTGSADSSPHGLARTFRQLGVVGFWVQLVIAAFPIAVGALLFSTNRAALLPGGRFAVMGYLAIASLLILVFTMVWFLGHARVGRQMRERPGSVALSKLSRRVWIGIAASGIGILFSTVVIIFEMAYLLVGFLEAPQAGVPVIQTGGDASWISAIDILGVMTLILTVAAEIVVLLFGLWLLYRTSQVRSEGRGGVGA